MHAPLGVNISKNIYYSPQIAFTDIVKMGREWQSTTKQDIAQDENGWVTQLQAGQVVFMTMFVGIDGLFPNGKYLCLYEGDGFIEFDRGAEVVSRSPGRIVLDVTSHDDGIKMQLSQINPNDYPRNIAVVPAEYEATYRTDNVFYPPFVERLKGYQCFRFMRWGVNNTSFYTGWKGRATPEYYSQGTDREVAVEYMVDLANVAGVDLYINPPHQADDEYLRGMARIIARRLNAGLSCWIEPTNEVFNTMFPQARYAKQKGTELGLTIQGKEFDENASRYLWYTRFAREVFKVFEEEFKASGDNPPEIMRVLGTFAANPWVTKIMLEFEDTADYTDAVAVGFYPGGSLGQADNEAVAEKMTVSEVLDALDKDIDEVLKKIADHVDFAAQHGVIVIAYEAGQHLKAGGAAQNNGTIVRLFTEANRHPRMGQLYTKMIEGWAEVTNGGLLVMFDNVASSSKFGAFGIYEHQFQPLEEAYKAAAIMKYINGTSAVVTDPVIEPAPETQEQTSEPIEAPETEPDAGPVIEEDANLNEFLKAQQALANKYHQLSLVHLKSAAAEEEKAVLFSSLADFYGYSES